MIMSTSTGWMVRCGRIFRILSLVLRCPIKCGVLTYGLWHAWPEQSMSSSTSINRLLSQTSPIQSYLLRKLRRLARKRSPFYMALAWRSSSTTMSRTSVARQHDRVEQSNVKRNLGLGKTVSDSLYGSLFHEADLGHVVSRLRQI